MHGLLIVELRTVYSQEDVKPIIYNVLEDILHRTSKNGVLEKNFNYYKQIKLIHRCTLALKTLIIILRL